LARDLLPERLDLFHQKILAFARLDCRAVLLARRGSLALHESSTQSFVFSPQEIKVTTALRL
jgi:hypothetical protein